MRETAGSTSGKRVRIVGDHPHRGSTGTVRDDLPTRAFGMWRVDLDPNPTMTEACFAGPENLRALPTEEDPDGA